MAIIPENRPAKNKPASNGDGRESYLLVRKIIALSNANVWHEAKTEWELEAVWSEPEGVCLCGHAPITEQCLIRNRVNGSTAIVGNVCVTRFLGLPSDRLFTSFKRIMADTGKALNVDALEYASRRNWLNSWELSFYRDTLRLRKLSERQRAKRAEINGRLLSFLAAVGKGGDTHA